MTDHIPPATALMRPMQFDETDLQANRDGRLGANQRARLQGLQTRILLFGAGGFFAISLVAAGFLFVAQGNSAAVLRLLGILLTILNAVLVGMVGRQWMRLSADLRSTQVEIISGPMERVVRADGRMNNFLLRVDGEDFHVNKDLFKLFRHEIPYRIYRAPHSRVLLAAEPNP